MSPSGRAGRPQGPYVRLGVVTAVALAPAVLLLGAMLAPIHPDCFEYCTLGRDFAALGLILVGELWLLAVLLIAWGWRSRETALPAIGAIAATPLLIWAWVGTIGLLGYDAVFRPLTALAWILGMGLQLPGLWRLAGRTPGSMPLRLVVGLMHLATIVGALAILLAGTSVVSGTGPVVLFFAWVLFVTCLIPVTAAAWRDRVVSPARVSPLLAVSLLMLLVPVAFARPGDIAYLILLALPLSGFAWVWLTAPWLRSSPDDA